MTDETHSSALHSAITVAEIAKESERVKADHAQLVALVKALPAVNDVMELVELVESHRDDAPAACLAVDNLLQARKELGD